MTRRSNELRGLLSRGRTKEINERFERTQGRIAHAKDPDVKAQFEAALSELEEQRGMGRRIELACARLEARQQRCITALERLHVALIHNSAALTDSTGLQEALTSLQRLTEEMHWKNLPVEDLMEKEGLQESDDLDERDFDAHLEGDEAEVSADVADSLTNEEPIEDDVESLSRAEQTH